MESEMTLNVNGAVYHLALDTRTTLLDALRGRRSAAERVRQAAEDESADAQPLPGNAFKVPLARNLLVRTLLDLAAAEEDA
jgi:xanthine dehydrogenase YagS FAD-binding subunit